MTTLGLRRERLRNDELRALIAAFFALRAAICSGVPRRVFRRGAERFTALRRVLVFAFVFFRFAFAFLKVAS